MKKEGQRKENGEFGTRNRMTVREKQTRRK